MEPLQFIKIMKVGIAVTLGAIVLAGTSDSSPRVQPQDVRDNDEESLIRLGFEVSPVPPNLTGKDPKLVGLGSYIVNRLTAIVATTAAALLTSITRRVEIPTLASGRW